MASAALLRFLRRHAERVSASYFLHQIEIKTLKQVQGDAVFYPIGAQVRLLALLDNLGKGASGAAVQNLNIMAGLDETIGLRL